MAKKLSKAKQIEKDYYKRLKEQNRVIAYKAKFGIKPIKTTTVLQDAISEEYLKSLPEKGIKGSVSKLSNKLGNRRKLSKKSKKKDKKQLNFYSSKEWRDVRYRALKLHGRQCLCCGAKPPQVVLHVDHIKPRSLRPDLELDINNLQILCEDCNLGKSNKDSIDYRPK